MSRRAINTNVQEPDEDFDDFQEPSSYDLLKAPLFGRLLMWRHSRTLLQLPLLLISIAMILHGLMGPTISPKNLATVLTWVHFRGALMLALLCAGNVFCMACPFMAARNFMRRLIHPRLTWPRALRNKWIPTVLFALLLFVYELFGLWSSPWLTAWTIIGYFTAILIIDGAFKHATFCKFICPVGQFNFLAATVSPLEVKTRDKQTCSNCLTKDCIRGAHAPHSDFVILQRGCELALFQPNKIGNMDCTFCLDCVHACPHDNIGILSRLPAGELMEDPLRSGIGYLSRRKDIAALAVVFCFGALMNAFGMVAPIYSVESWLSRLLHIRYLAPILGLLFVAVLVIGPAVLLGLAAFAARRWAAINLAPLSLIVRYSYCLVPLGFGMWLAHYGYHLLTGLYTIIPVVQSAFVDFGYPILGDPLWTLVGIPQYLVQPMEFGSLLLGTAGSLLLAWHLAEQDSLKHPIRAFAPWAAVCLVLLLCAMWLVTQPMDMRATLMAG